MVLKKPPAQGEALAGILQLLRARWFLEVPCALQLSLPYLSHFCCIRDSFLSEKGGGDALTAQSPFAFVGRARGGGNRTQGLVHTGQCSTVSSVSRPESLKNNNGNV